MGVVRMFYVCCTCAVWVIYVCYIFVVRECSMGVVRMFYWSCSCDLWVLYLCSLGLGRMF